MPFAQIPPTWNMIIARGLFNNTGEWRRGGVVYRHTSQLQVTRPICLKWILLCDRNAEMQPNFNRKTTNTKWSLFSLLWLNSFFLLSSRFCCVFLSLPFPLRRWCELNIGNVVKILQSSKSQKESVLLWAWKESKRLNRDETMWGGLSFMCWER